MDYSMPCLLVPHYLLEFAQVQVHWIGDTIQPSHPLPQRLPFAFSFCLQSLPASASFPVSWLLASDAQIIEASTASVLPMSIQGWFPFSLTGLISLFSKRLSRVFSSTTIWKHQFSVLSLPYGPTLTSIHDYWKDHSFDSMDLMFVLSNTLSRFVIDFLPRSKQAFFNFMVAVTICSDFGA